MMDDPFAPPPSAQPRRRAVADPTANPKTASAAEPKYGRTFDPWNSSATGHQTAENRHPQGWRESRTRKLRSQLLAGHTGGVRIVDSVGRGSEQYDEANKVFIPKGIGIRAETSVADMLRKPGVMRQGSNSISTASGDDMARKDLGDVPATDVGTGQESARMTEDLPEPKLRRKGIFSGLVIYVNGSTHPLISDHKLKRLLAENGAQMSIHLGRRQVTHVVVGRPIGSDGPPGETKAGAGSGGGGLAATKIQKEIALMRGCSVKYVGVEW
jgi:hypothetical protein